MQRRQAKQEDTIQSLSIMELRGHDKEAKASQQVVGLL